MRLSDPAQYLGQSYCRSGLQRPSQKLRLQKKKSSRSLEKKIACTTPFGHRYDTSWINGGNSPRYISLHGNAPIVVLGDARDFARRPRLPRPYHHISIKLM